MVGKEVVVFFWVAAPASRAAVVQIKVLTLRGLMSGGAAAAGFQVDSTVLGLRVWRQRESFHSRRAGLSRPRNLWTWGWRTWPWRDHGAKGVCW